MSCCFNLFCYSTALRVEFYIKRLPLAIQYWLSGYECLSRRLPKTDYFSVYLIVQVAEWKQALSLCFSSRFSYSSNILCRRLRYKADESGITLVEGGRKISKKHKRSLVSLYSSWLPPLPLSLPTVHLTSEDCQAPPGRVLCLEFETTWLGDL